MLAHEILKFVRVSNCMQCEAQLHAPLTCEGFRGFKKKGGGGIRGRLRHSSPLVSLLDKRVFKFKVYIFKKIYYFYKF